MATGENEASSLSPLFVLSPGYWYMVYGVSLLPLFVLSPGYWYMHGVPSFVVAAVCVVSWLLVHGVARLFAVALFVLSAHLKFPAQCQLKLVWLLQLCSCFFLSYPIALSCLQMAKKRPRVVTDFEEVGQEPSTSAVVHGVISSLSPIKKGRKSKYFHGCVSDGKRSMRFVSFSERQLDSMEKFKESKRPVELKDCQLKRAKRGDELEIVMKSSTAIAPSPEKINISGIDFDDGVCPKVTVSDVKDKCVFDILDIDVKVCSVCTFS